MEYFLQEHTGETDEENSEDYDPSLHLVFYTLLFLFYTPFLHIAKDEQSDISIEEDESEEENEENSKDSDESDENNSNILDSSNKDKNSEVEKGSGRKEQEPLQHSPVKLTDKLKKVNTSKLPDHHLYENKSSSISHDSTNKSSTSKMESTGIRSPSISSKPLTHQPKASGLQAAIEQLRNKPKATTIYAASKKSWDNFKTKNNLTEELKGATDAGKGAQHGYVYLLCK